MKTSEWLWCKGGRHVRLAHIQRSEWHEVAISLRCTLHDGCSEPAGSLCVVRHNVTGRNLAETPNLEKTL
jgi:hypothetical protein